MVIVWNSFKNFRCLPLRFFLEFLCTYLLSMTSTFFNNMNVLRSKSRSPDIWIQTSTEETQRVNTVLKKAGKMKGSGIKQTNSLKPLQTRLKNTLECIELLKHDVSEKISHSIAKKNTYPALDKTECDSTELHIKNKTYEAISNKITKFNNEISINLRSCDLGSETSISDHIKSNSTQIINETQNVKDKMLDNSSEVMMKSLENDEVASNIPLRSSNNSILMISLISDDDSNSDCSIISVTPEDLDDSVTDSSTSHSNSCLSKTSTNLLKFEEETKKPLLSNESNQSGTIEGICEVRKRKSFESDNVTVKKKKNSKENNETADDNLRRDRLLGEFYKVKLSNLAVSSRYTDVATLLTNAGLDFIDLLLINSAHRSYAEVSFIHPSTREKALSMDKSLSLFGMKIKVRPL